MTQKFLMVSLSAIALLLVYALFMPYLQVTHVAAVNPSRHAESKHGWTAIEIVECVNTKGAYMHMTFRSRDGKFYIPCQMNDGKIGLGIFDSHGNNISAYVPRDGIWAEVRDYILQRAFHYRGPLPFKLGE